MNLTTHSLALACATSIAVGQVLFKYTANSLKLAGTPWDAGVLGLAATALGIYGLATLLWIALLQHAPLSRLYPYMALSFILVAGASWVLFKEQVDALYLLGLGLIVTGFLVIAASSP
jgi:drug/metabolite transporter (DMT)-like permease